MPANSRLDTGLFISRDDIITWAEGPVLPLLGVKIKYPASFFQELKDLLGKSRIDETKGEEHLHATIARC